MEQISYRDKDFEGINWLTVGNYKELFELAIERIILKRVQEELT